MSKQANPTRTCDDCFHCQACHMWSNGAFSATVAAKCPQFEPVRYASLKALQDVYKMHKGEVAPVIHARWLLKDDGEGLRRVCSSCGKESKQETPFCAQCGAMMDGGKENVR